MSIPKSVTPTPAAGRFLDTQLCSRPVTCKTFIDRNEFFVPQVNDVMRKQQNFASCVAQHLPFLTRFVSGAMRGDQSAEDIVQQTVLKALMNADQFRCESSLKTWLVSIAINEARQAYRCGWHRRTVPLVTESLDSIRSLESSSKTYQANQRAVLVRKAVSRLPQAYRSVVELCDFQQLPMSEAARQLGLTLPAIKSRRHRARQKLLPLVQELKFSSQCG
jgi:RNA polymerase sigma-70 factor, ECF subfamily